LKRKILILGSIASGKTILARRLGKAFELPVIHVDSLEFNTDLSKKNIDLIRTNLKSALDRPEWILDGHGPLDMLPSHLKSADCIVFIDFPYRWNVLWLIKRQMCSLFRPRPEMPKGANEWNWNHFIKMLQTLQKQHQLMNPELLRILQRPENQSRLIHVKTPSDLDEVVRVISS